MKLCLKFSENLAVWGNELDVLCRQEREAKASQLQA